MSRFDRMSGGDSAFPARLRKGAGTELERRVLDAAASELPSPELCDRMALAIGVAPPLQAPIEQGPLDLGAPSAVSGGSRALLTWLSAGAAVALAAGIIAARSSETSPTPAPSAPAPVPSGMSWQLARAPSSVTPSLAPAPSALTPPAAPAVSVTTPSLRSRPTQAPADIQEQIALIDAARAAVAGGSSNRALGLVRQYQGKYPTGSFRPEAAALKIEALTQLGRSAEARRLADGFVAEYGGGPLADRVSRLSGRARP